MITKNKVKNSILFGYKHQGIHTVKAPQILKNTPSFQIARPHLQVNRLKPNLVQLQDQSRLNNVARLSFLSRHPLQLSLSAMRNNTLMPNSKFRLPHNTTMKSMVTTLKLNQKISLIKAVPNSKNLPFQFSNPLLLSNLRKNQLSRFQLFASRDFSLDSESDILIKLKISVEKIAVQPLAAVTLGMVISAIISGIASGATGFVLEKIFGNSGGKKLYNFIKAELAKVQHAIINAIHDEKLQEISSRLSGIASTLNAYEREHSSDTTGFNLKRLAEIDTAISQLYYEAVGYGLKAFYSIIFAGTLRISIADQVFKATNKTSSAAKTKYIYLRDFLQHLDPLIKIILERPNAMVRIENIYGDPSVMGDSGGWNVRNEAYPHRPILDYSKYDAERRAESDKKDLTDYFTKILITPIEPLLEELESMKKELIQQYPEIKEEITSSPASFTAK